MDSNEFKKLLQQQKTEIVSEVTEKTERYMGALKEDFDHKLDVVLELVQDIPAIKTKLDLTFDKVGELAVDVEIIKETVKDHEHRLQKLEAR